MRSSFPASAAAEIYTVAAEIFHEHAATDLTGALTEFLAAVLSCSPAAVISPDLADRLVAAGVSRDLAERAGALVADLVGARYGGESGGEELRRATELVEQMKSVTLPRSST